jgi:hypothetical protein
MRLIREKEEQEHDERSVVVNAERAQKAALQAETRSKRAAADESAALGLQAGEYHVRPDGKAPDGMTWSFRLGEWVEPERLKKKSRIEDAVDVKADDVKAEGPM